MFSERLAGPEKFLIGQVDVPRRFETAPGVLGRHETFYYILNRLILEESCQFELLMWGTAMSAIPNLKPYVDPGN